MPLVENDLKHLTAAHGYVELGMFLNANAELEEWELMQAVSKAPAIHDPVDRSGRSHGSSVLTIFVAKHYPRSNITSNNP